MSQLDLLRWPAKVRQSVLRDGFGVELPKEYLRTEMERGAKQRRISTGGAAILTCRFRFPLDEYKRFRHFFDHELPASGDLRFYWRNPETRNPAIGQAVVEDGRIYVPSPAPGLNRFVDMKIETWDLPQDFIFEAAQ